MDFQFQGFHPVFSASLLVTLLFAVLIFSWWSYAYLKSIPALWRWSLILLRGSALVILFILLLNPFMEYAETEYHRPVVAVYLDDSQSMGVQRESHNGRETYLSVIESFQFENIEDAEVRFYRFGSGVQALDHYDNLDLDGGVTNIHEVMRHIHDQSGQIVAAVMFSDGIVTRGRDPVFIARELDLPLFTVPVGDTTEIQDIAVTDVITNETGYVDTQQPVEVTVSQDGFPGESTNVQIMKDGEIIGSEQIEFSSESSQHRLTFELQFDEEGLHNFEAYATELGDEATIENNRYPFSVNVIDEKIKVVHLASEIHPDVKSLRSMLTGDRNIDLHPFTWLGDRFAETGQFDLVTEDIDLLILHGDLPDDSGIPEDIAQRPVLQFLTPGMVNSGRQAEEEADLVIPISANRTDTVLRIHMQMAETGRMHSVVDFEQPTDLSRLPVLFVNQAEYELPSTATVLYQALHEGSETDIPVIVVEETGNTRRSFVNAYGWFAWSLAADSRTREFSEQLLSNLTAWTTASPESENLMIEPGKQVYQEGEDVWFRGELVRETGEPETNAVIEVRVRNEEDDERSYTMNHRSRGSYQLSAGSMTAGEYTYRADAKVAGTVIESAEGEFTVTPSVLEYLDTKRDDDMLRELASITGGFFLEEQAPSPFLRELNDRNLLQQIEESHSAFRFLHQYLIWFLIVIALLGAEWLLRRRYSLP